MSSKTQRSSSTRRGLTDPARNRGEVSVDLENTQLDQADLAETFSARKAHFAAVWRQRQLLAADLCELDAALDRFSWQVDDRKAAAVTKNFEKHAQDLQCLTGPRALERVLKLPQARAS